MFKNIIVLAGLVFCFYGESMIVQNKYSLLNARNQIFDVSVENRQKMVQECYSNLQCNNKEKVQAMWQLYRTVASPDVKSMILDVLVKEAQKNTTTTTITDRDCQVAALLILSQTDDSNTKLKNGFDGHIVYDAFSILKENNSEILSTYKPLLEKTSMKGIF